MSVAREHRDGVTLSLKAKPGAKKNAVLGIENDRLKVSVTAKAEDGKANDAILKLLRDRLGFGKSQIELISGATHREKVVLLRGVTLEEVQTLLRQIA